MKHKEAHALDNTVKLIVRGQTYASLARYSGIEDKLNQEWDLPSDYIGGMISNFAALVSRTVDIQSNSDDIGTIGKYWVEMFGYIKEREYMQAFEEYLELNTLAEDNLFNVWDKAIASTDDVALSEDFAPPERLDKDAKKNSKKSA